MELIIWWLSQGDCELITASPRLYFVLQGEEEVVASGLLAAPAYVSAEFESRLGRAGRCRLWVSDELALPAQFGIKWPEETAMARRLSAGSYGGIVMRASDLLAVTDLPGIITDLQLNQIGTARAL